VCVCVCVCVHTCTSLKRSLQSSEGIEEEQKCRRGDDLKAEQLKYEPDIVFESIEEIFNTIATTGESPTEVKDGILIPIQKPGKAKWASKSSTSHHSTLNASKSTSNLHAMEYKREDQQ